MRALFLLLLLSACIDDGSWGDDDTAPVDDDTTTADDDTSPADDDSADDDTADDDTSDDDTSPGDDDASDDDTADDDSSPADDDTADDDDATPDPDDADGDGFDRFAAGGEDCDDADPSAYPGATENPADGADDDCDGSIDEAITVLLLFPDDGISGLGTYVEVGGTAFWGVETATLGGLAVVDLFVFSDDLIGFVTPTLNAGAHDLVLSHDFDTVTQVAAFTSTDTASTLDEGELVTQSEQTLALGGSSTLFEATVTEPGLTDAVGIGAGLAAEIGYGYEALPPDSSADWWWSTAVFLTDDGGSDRFNGAVTPHQYGSYNIAFRFSEDGGTSWLYVDSDASTPMDWMELPVVHVVP